MKLYPLTARVRVLCIDKEGTRSVIPLKLIKRIQDRIDLPIPLQKFFKVAFKVSSGTPFNNRLRESALTLQGGLIILAMFVNR